MYLSTYKLKNFFIIVTLACSIHFYGLLHRLGNFTYQLIDVTYYSLVALFLLLVIANKTRARELSNQQSVVSMLLLGLLVFLVISALSASIFHQQSFPRTLVGMRYFSYFALFYLLIFVKFRYELLIKVCVFFAIIYVAVFSAQYIVFPTEIVPINNIKDFDRGLLRFRIEGVGFMTLIGFYFLNQYLNENKIRYFFAFSIAVFFVFALGFRTLLVAYLLGAVCLLFISDKLLVYKVKVLTLSFLLFLLSWFFLGLDEYFFSALELSKTQLQLEEEYIRFKTFNFLFNYVNENFVTLIFGNGMPIEGTRYGGLVLGYGSSERGFISADLGMIGFSFNYGITSSIMIYSLLITSSFYAFKSNQYFIIAFNVYLLASSVTTAEIFRAGMFGVLTVSLYLSTYFRGNENA